MFRGVFPTSTDSAVVVVCVTTDGIVLGKCVLISFVLIPFEVITISLSSVWTVAGLDVIVVDEYPLVAVMVLLLSFDGALATVLGSCVSTGSLTQEGSVEPSAPDGL